MSCRVLQLVPSSKTAGKLTALSLMDDELRALHNRGIINHTIVHECQAGLEPVLFQHTVPRLRNLNHSTKSALDCARYSRLDGMAAKSISERFGIARSLRWITKVVRSHEISVIHSHWARPNGTAAALSKLVTGIPLVMTLRGADVLQESEIGYGNTLDPWFVRRLRFAFQVADRVLGVSSRIVERAIELGADPARTHVVHKGVDTHIFRPGDARQAKSQLGLPDKPTILFVGALGSWKGVMDLLNAFLSVKSRLPDTQLVMCGKGDLLSDINVFAAKHGLSGEVHLPGHVNRELIPIYFQACDVFVLPSLTEGSGNVLLEAAACAKPTVGTRVGGIPDYILDGQTGLLCEKKNPHDLAQKLLLLIQDCAMAKKFGACGLARVCNHFRYEQMIDKILAIYDGLQR